MKILFLIYHGFSEHSGISKKILAQVKGLEENGHEVHICTYIVDEKGYRKRMVNGQVIQVYGNGVIAKIKKRCCYKSIITYAEREKIKLVYVRSFHNANPFTISLFKRLNKKGIKSIMEIPTYPYDTEYIGADWRVSLNLRIDKLFRHQLAKQMEAIVTFSNETSIFNQRTIRISNGVNFNELPIRQPSNRNPDEIHLIGVAEVHFWHGYDRLIHGLGKYYKTENHKKIFFHIVGGVSDTEMYDTPHAPGFDLYIKKYMLEKQIIFHNQLFGEALDKIFDQADFAVGSLARHRTHISQIKTLKNREYAARGIPFIYSETDEDFDDMPYILKAPANESPIDILSIIQFIENFNLTPEFIRNSIKQLSWREQMRKVLIETSIS